jgi:hypothetical protein
MSRLSLIRVVALVSVLAPSVVHAQYAVVSPCGDGVRTDCARISVIPAPPTGVPEWLQPKPSAPPVYVPPPPVNIYVAPPAPRGGGIHPSIPLRARGIQLQNPLDVMQQITQLQLTQQQLVAARAYAAPAVVAPAPRQGSLRLKITPREGQVSVDGVFVGTVDDFDGAFQKLGLHGGGHRIKITAPGHDTIAFEVLITPNEMVTYKGKLPRVQ